MNKKLINIFLVFLFSISLFAKELNKEAISKFANNWLVKNQSFLHYGEYRNSKETFSFRTVTPILGKDGERLLYVVSLTPKGFVLISPDDRLQPIVGYSSEHNFNFENARSDFFMGTVIADLNENLMHMEKENIQTASSKWSEEILSLKKTSSVKNNEEIIGPFLDSDWGQGYVRGNPVFNYYAPNRWPTGCVATASAQILNYYKWPYQGYGSHGYYDNGKYLSADFGNTFYDWANTLDKYSDTYFNLANQQAAGLLTYHAAVALEMDFEYNGSTASTSDVPGIMHNYFRYSGHYSSVSSSGFWEAMKNNMLDERPAIISIKSSQHSVGHAAVVDGYFNTNGYYHCNPGWYGDYNGWYNISGDWQMETYDIVVGAAKGIVPSPQVNDIERVSENSFIVSWRTSIHQKADFYELRQARSSSGPWTTLSDNIVDTTYLISNVDQGSYYYKVRANRDNIWWDFSKIKKIQLGTERQVTFQVDMTYLTITEKDTLVIRGNIPPLAGNINSAAMEKTDSTNIYRLNINFDYDYVGQTLIYRFFIQSKDELVPENKNREYVITSEASQVLPPVYFNDAVSVKDGNSFVPEEFKLEQNYPNPFNPSTTINYSIHSKIGDNNLPINVTLKVYDVLGKEVATLVNKEQSNGNYSVQFNANNLSAGIYFYKIRAGNFIQTKKMILIK